MFRDRASNIEPSTLNGLNIGDIVSSIPLIPTQAAVAVADLVDNCAKVKPGMNVLIVGANDGLHGGVNIVDRETVAWVHAAIVERGADATVYGVISRTVRWCSGATAPIRVRPGAYRRLSPALCAPQM